MNRIKCKNCGGESVHIEGKTKLACGKCFDELKAEVEGLEEENTNLLWESDKTIIDLKAKVKLLKETVRGRNEIFNREHDKVLVLQAKVERLERAIRNDSRRNLYDNQIRRLCDTLRVKDGLLVKACNKVERLEEILNKLCELSCYEDITKEFGKDFVCSMRVNEVTFVKAKEPLQVIDYIFNSLKASFFKKVKALQDPK